MLNYIDRYLAIITEPASRRVVRADLMHFANWWEQHHGRVFDPGQFLARDVQAWVRRRQDSERRPSCAAPTAANRESTGPSISSSEAELEAASPHALLHALARRLLRCGADLAEVQRILGHARLSTTGIYTVPNEHDLRDAIERAGV